MPNYKDSDGLTYKLFKTITPHDTTVQTEVSAFMVTDDTSGNAVKITGIDSDSEAVVLHCVKGVVYPFEVSLIWSTGTTADTIVSCR